MKRRHSALEVQVASHARQDEKGIVGGIVRCDPNTAMCAKAMTIQVWTRLVTVCLEQEMGQVLERQATMYITLTSVHGKKEYVKGRPRSALVVKCSSLKVAPEPDLTRTHLLYECSHVFSSTLWSLIHEVDTHTAVRNCTNFLIQSPMHASLHPLLQNLSRYKVIRLMRGAPSNAKEKYECQ